VLERLGAGSAYARSSCPGPCRLGFGLPRTNQPSAVPKDALIPGLGNPNVLEWTLRCLSAALTEEIAFRFGAMSLFVWVIRSVVKRGLSIGHRCG